MEFSAAVLVDVAKFFWTQRDSLKRKPSDVASDLRLVRFDEQGLLSLLKAISSGKPLPAPLAASKLQAFNDGEWAVSDALLRLSEDCPAISQRMRRELLEVAYRKKGVRADIQQSLNASPEAHLVLSRDQAKAFLKDIKALNDAIEESEDVLLHGRRGG